MQGSHNDLDDADQFFEEGRFSDARDAYRRILMTSEPSDVVLNNLRMAEFGEALTYRQSLSQRCPSNLVVLLSEIQLLLDGHHGDAAFQRCNSLLNKCPWSPREEFKIRHMRLISGISSDKATHFSDDFMQIYHIIKSYFNNIRILREHIRLVASIQSPSFIKALTQINADIRRLENGDGKHIAMVLEIINSKINELVLLDQL
jgi:hypothetical protein